jgi:hypothetical protein
MSEHLLHSAMSAVAVDPLIERPVWTENVVSNVRWLPCKYQDVIQGGQYSSTINLDATDSLACFKCDDRIKNEMEFQSLLKSFPGVKTIIIESAESTKLLNRITALLENAGGSIEADIVMGSRRSCEDFVGGKSARQMLLITK